MKYLSNINLNQNELQNARIQNLGTAPSNPKAGQVYHNTSDNKTYVYNGTSWIDLTNSGSVTNVNATAPIQSSGGTTPTISIVSASNNTSGSMSSSHYSKLEGIASGATKVEDGTSNGDIKITDSAGTTSVITVYSHPTGDGNLHVPATGTSNGGKVLKAGSTAGSLSWGTVSFSEISSKPTTLSGYGITDGFSKSGGTLSGDTIIDNRNSTASSSQISAQWYYSATTDIQKISLFSGESGYVGLIKSYNGVNKASLLISSSDALQFNVSGTMYNVWHSGNDGANSGLDSDLLDGQHGTHYLSRANHTGTQTASTISDFDTQVRTSRLDQMSAPTTSVSMNNNKITNVADPIYDTDVANKGYVDSVAQGLDVKDSVRVATTTNLVLVPTTKRTSLTIDGISLSAGDRVLVKSQTTASENGIYVVESDFDLVRSNDANESTDVTSGMFVFVEQGTNGADTGWVLTTDGSIALGSTSLTFTQFSGAGSVEAGDGLSRSGTTISANYDGTSIDTSSGKLRIDPAWTGQTAITTVGTISSGTWQGTDVGVAYGGTGSSTASGARSNLGATGKHSSTITGDGVATSFTISHSLATSDLAISLYDGSGNMIITDVSIVNTSSFNVVFATAPSTSESYKVVAVG